MPSSPKYKFDDFEADVSAAELRRGGTRLKMQLQPFQVLMALLERPGEVVTRDELRQRLWPEDTFVDFDHGLNTAMAKVREVLGDSASKPRYVETIAKRGYRFLGKVQPGAPTADPPSLPQSPVTEKSAAAITESGIAKEEVVTDLPRASRTTSRSLFMLSQIMYLIFYLSALLSWEKLAESASRAWRGGGQAAFVIYFVTALAGIVVRLYLITATALDYHLLGQKYRVLFPGLLILDMVWALAPFLIADRIGFGLALAATAALMYMPFAQRVLMKMITS